MNNPPKHIVLYADDDPDDLALVREAFEEFANNVQVVTALDGGQALAHLKKFENNQIYPCLIILDVNMPVLNGKQVLQALRGIKAFDNTPVVLFTTSSSPADKHAASKFKAGFISKPLNMQQMEMITQEFISHCSDEIRRNISRKLPE